MAIAALRPRVHERGFARTIERRSPQAGVSSTSSVTSTFVQVAEVSPSPTPNQVFSTPSTSVKALAGAIAVLGLILLVIVVWKIGKWRRKRLAARASQRKATFGKGAILDLEASFATAEKVPVLAPAPAAPGTEWVPQIRSMGVTVPAPVKKKSSLRSKSKWDKAVSKLHIPQYSPPPAYLIANGGLDTARSSLPPPPPPPPPPQVICTPPPPTPPASLKLKFDFSDPPIKSPHRSASVAPATSLSVKSSSSARHKLPRLMTVVMTFDPSLEDELPVRLGETVRLIEEYEDEWCLVQRVGKMNAEKGVVPRFCLEDRPGIVPTAPLKIVSRP